MSRTLRVFHILTIVCLAQLVKAQTDTTIHSAPIKEDKAVSILSTTVATMGGIYVKDFFMTGSVTYYVGSKEEAGDVTIKMHDQKQFRLDASLPNRTISLFSDQIGGRKKKPDGSVGDVPYHTAVMLGSTLSPSVRMTMVLKDPDAAIEYVGLEAIDSHEFHHIRVSYPNIRKDDPDVAIRTLHAADYFIDPTTSQLYGMQDHTHPADNLTVTLPHAVYFADYIAVDNVMLPTTISEYVNDQRITRIHISDVKLNQGVNGSDLSF